MTNKKEEQEKKQGEEIMNGMEDVKMVYASPKISAKAFCIKATQEQIDAKHQDIVIREWTFGQDSGVSYEFQTKALKGTLVGVFITEMTSEAGVEIKKINFKIKIPKGKELIINDDVTSQFGDAMLQKAPNLVEGNEYVFEVWVKGGTKTMLIIDTETEEKLVSYYREYNPELKKSVSKVDGYPEIEDAERIKKIKDIEERSYEWKKAFKKITNFMAEDIKNNHSFGFDNQTIEEEDINNMPDDIW